MRTEFGPACVKLVAANLALGSATSSERWVKDDRRQFKMGIHAEDFADAAAIMTAHMKRLNIKPPVWLKMRRQYSTGRITTRPPIASSDSEGQCAANGITSLDSASVWIDTSVA